MKWNGIQYNQRLIVEDLAKNDHVKAAFPLRYGRDTQIFESERMECFKR